jgi:curved DNA-binding protein CbpA
MFKDYYQILEISQTATLAEIKSAYRKQALKWHPDKNKGIDTTDKMRDVIEAKELLSDEIKRIRYDTEYVKYYSYFREELKKKEEEKFNQQRKTEECKSKKADSTYDKSDDAKDTSKTYQFEDQILNEWVKNARTQAAKNLFDIIDEFRDSAKLGFESFFKTAIMALVIGSIYFVIVKLLNKL